MNADGRGRAPAAAVQAMRRMAEMYRSELAAVQQLMRAELHGMPEAPSLLDFVEGGKMLRSLLCLLAADAAGGRASAAVPAAAAVELLHSASLIHDDIIDQAATRRGRPAVHRALGEGVAIALGDCLLAAAIGLLASRPGLHDGAAMLARRAQECCRGQVAELLDADRMMPEDCLRMMREKTGALFAGAAELGALAAGAGSHVSDATGRFGAAFGLVFQIYDDLLDLLATPGSTGKPTGEASHLTRPMRPLILLRDRAPAVALRDLAAAPRREVTLELLETYDVAADRLRYADAALADATAALDGLKSSVARQSLSALVAQARAACDAMLVVDGDAMAVTALP